MSDFPFFVERIDYGAAAGIVDNALPGISPLDSMKLAMNVLDAALVGEREAKEDRFFFMYGDRRGHHRRLVTDWEGAEG